MATNVRAVFNRKKKATPTTAAKVEIEIFFSRKERKKEVKWAATGRRGKRRGTERKRRGNGGRRGEVAR